VYAIHHPMQESFTEVTYRPELKVTGYPSWIHSPEIHSRVSEMDEANRPQVLAARAWGAQSDDGDWDYVETPRSSRPRGGTANGGIVYTPPEFELEDYLGINHGDSDVDSPSTTSYVAMAPGVCMAFGSPASDGGMSGAGNGSRTLAQDSASGNIKMAKEDGSRATPVNDQDLVDKKYVDDNAGGSEIIHVYDATGGAAAGAQLAMDTTQLNQNGSNYVLGAPTAGAVTINDDGTYEIEYTASHVEATGIAPANVQVQVQTTPSGTGVWANVLSGDSFSDHAAMMPASCSGRCYVVVSGGAIDVQLATVLTAGAAITIAQGSSMTIRKVA
jgi:hypothetical protein